MGRVRASAVIGLLARWGRASPPLHDRLLLMTYFGRKRWPRGCIPTSRR